MGRFVMIMLGLLILSGCQKVSPQLSQIGSGINPYDLKARPSGQISMGTTAGITQEGKDSNGQAGLRLKGRVTYTGTPLTAEAGPYRLKSRLKY